MIYPPHFDPNRKYPAILYCEGGPQSTVDQFWSYRWNFQQMAANGYIIVAPNRRGCRDGLVMAGTNQRGLFRSEHQGLPFRYRRS